ncbi:MAG TPA: DUF4097 domain-containing protein [Clostridiales bacterium]|nr:DUF4097 domain-containing protein [Clostridiales bacterium]
MEKETKKVGMITLAISLIGIGLIFLLDNFFDLAPIKDPGLLWPAILIIFGTELVITKKIHSKKENTAKLSVDVLSLILIIIIILALIAANIATNLGLLFTDLNPGSVRFSTNLGAYKYKTSTTFSSGPIDTTAVNNGKIIIENYHGNISIFSNNDDSLLVEAYIEVKNNDSNLAKDYLEKAIKIDARENIKISTQLPDNRNIICNPAVNYTIYVPQDVDTFITNVVGNINAQDLLNTLVIDNNNGEIVVSNINGNVDIKNSLGTVQANNIEGIVSIDNKEGSINVEKIHGNANLTANLGSITARDVTGYLTAKNSNGSIKATDIKGEADLKTSLGSITMENLYKKITASTSSGSIKLDNTFELEDDVLLSTGFGNIQVFCPSVNNATVRASTGFGNIQSEGLLDIDKKGDGCTGRAVLGNGSKSIKLTTGEGSITLHKK